MFQIILFYYIYQPFKHYIGQKNSVLKQITVFNTYSQSISFLSCTLRFYVFNVHQQFSMIALKPRISAVISWQQICELGPYNSVSRCAQQTHILLSLRNIPLGIASYVIMRAPPGRRLHHKRCSFVNLVYGVQ